ncbi:alpha/beta hydrolase family protein [Marilutibacter alkalisoli]|uniref:Alpha/beta hydrolase n=1 Tax=Marilutibacter alkalisoli TaxID=2591633 RepID=A0A514BNJ8_9GAMM|nr:alpha/beta fold hydrolase [Lysobacter alkalisoli]QDH68968.1 alpha/beta hydrolase [Lysobacter alkalisoli]
MNIHSILSAALAGTLLFAASTHAAEPEHCHSGAYRFTDGGQMLVQPSDEDNLRYRWLDGATGKLFPTGPHRYESGPGWSGREPVSLTVEFGECDTGTVVYAPVDGTAREGRRIALPTVPITFENDGASLYGELVLPEQSAPKALVVLQYGGGRDSAVLNNYVQYLLPLSDIAVFLYDKRGTGRSGGQFNLHIGMQADDLVAALAAARRDPRVAGIPVGLMGESQGGWVAPLAATTAPVDFVVASYGLAVSMQEEDRLEVEQQLRSRGHGPEALAKGLEMHRIALRVAISRFTEGVEEWMQARNDHAGEAWFQDIGGDITSTLMLTPEEQLPAIRAFLDVPYDLEYDPLPTLRSLGIPQLWLLAEDDTEAPIETTLARLQMLAREGRPIDTIVFPQADHGMIAIEPGSERRLAGRTAPGYFERLSAWILRQARVTARE